MSERTIDGGRGREVEPDVGRAGELEDRAAALGAKVGSLEGELRAAREALESSERRRELEVELIRAGAIDVETARILAERGEGKSGARVSRLRKEKPFLFRGAEGGRVGGAAMAARREEGREAAIERARDAAERGDRGALLRYLRTRRDAARGSGA